MADDKVVSTNRTTTGRDVDDQEYEARRLALQLATGLRRSESGVFVPLDDAATVGAAETFRQFLMDDG